MAYAERGGSNPNARLSATDASGTRIGTGRAVEVFDGMSWVPVFQTGGPPITDDTAWTPQSIDISAYANAAMRVRFGFVINQNGVFTCSSWNLDDVAIVSGPCL